MKWKHQRKEERPGCPSSNAHTAGRKMFSLSIFLLSLDQLVFQLSDVQTSQATFQVAWWIQTRLSAYMKEQHRSNTAAPTL